MTATTEYVAVLRDGYARTKVRSVDTDGTAYPGEVTDGAKALFRILQSKKPSIIRYVSSTSNEAITLAGVRLVADLERPEPPVTPASDYWRTIQRLARDVDAVGEGVNADDRNTILRALGESASDLAVGVAYAGVGAVGIAAIAVGIYIFWRLSREEF